MRKIVLIRLICLLSILISLPISAYDFESGGIYYSIIRNTNEVTVTYGDSHYQGDIVIPEKITYNGIIYSITHIANRAFEGCKGLISIVIPNSIMSIGKDAFGGCTGLKSFIIPSSVTSIDECAFLGCSSLASITFPNSLIDIVGGAFDETPWYENQPDGLVYAGSVAYSYKGEMPVNTNISLMEGTLGIASGAFYGCSGLSSITIPNSVESIGSAAFYDCSGLTSIIIPNSVTFISDNAFSGCSGLTSIKVESGNTKYDSRNSCNAITETASNTLIRGCKNTIIPNSVTSIGWGAFYGCSALISITIPNSVTSIGGMAFESCSGLTSITIPNSVSSIGYKVFQRCSGLSSIVSEIKSPFVVDCFDDNIYSKATLTIPQGTKAAYQATEGWKDFNNIVEETTSSETYTTDPKQTIHVAIAGSLSSYISDSDKYGIEDLTLTGSLNGSDFRLLREMAGVNRLGERTDGSLKVLDISGAKIVSGGDRYIDVAGGVNFSIEKNDVIPEYVFHDCRLKEIKLPIGLKEIEDEAFEKCTLLEKVEFFDELSIIGEEAFNGCKRLGSLTIPSSVSSIAPRAFFDCSGLTSVSSEIVSPFVISSDVFSSDTYDNASLIVPQNTLSKYKSTSGWNNFKTMVEYITSERVESNGIEYLCSFDEKTATITSVSNSLKDVRIPSSIMGKSGEYSVISISDFALNGCNLNYLSLPETITTLTEETFSGCSICAMSWNANTQLFKKAFRNTTMSTDYNFLLYVNSADYAPQTVKNVVVGNMAETIALSDSGDGFYCPKSFTAKKISYTHHFGMETGGNGKGWETIALPFNVQKISHATRGEIVPFASYNGGSSQKPFWLASMVSSGFRSSSSIQANTPYIIAMPNSNKYQNEYNLAGDVTFSAENVSVPATPTFSGTFVPAYSTVTKSSNVHALNVVNKYVSNSGGYDAGSRFISNLRDIRPFEAYISQGSSTRGIIEIGFGDGTTGMADVIGVFDADRPIDIYTLSGQKVAQGKQSEIENILNQLPHGVYIVNGKKIVK